VDELKHAQRERLIYLDRCFTWRGSANRRDLVEKFGISTPQAALDFGAYLKLVEKNPPSYDAARKAYFSNRRHRPIFDSSLTDAFEVLSENAEPFSLSSVPQPQRSADPRIITQLYQSLKSNVALLVKYTSMTSGDDKAQWIAPTHFSSDGESIHVRAFSFKHLEFRDYLPIRVSPESSFERRALNEPLPEDKDWQTIGRYWLQPKSTLSLKQAAVVKLEYGFSDDTLLLETRKALEIYLLRRWRVGDANSRLELAKKEYSRIASAKG